MRIEGHFHVLHAQLVHKILFLALLFLSSSIEFALQRGVGRQQGASRRHFEDLKLLNGGLRAWELVYGG